MTDREALIKAERMLAEYAGEAQFEAHVGPLGALSVIRSQLAQPGHDHTKGAAP